MLKNIDNKKINLLVNFDVNLSDNIAHTTSLKYFWILAIIIIIILDIIIWTYLKENIYILYEFLSNYKYSINSINLIVLNINIIYVYL